MDGGVVCAGGGGFIYSTQQTSQMQCSKFCLAHTGERDETTEDDGAIGFKP